MSCCGHPWSPLPHPTRPLGPQATGLAQLWSAIQTLVPPVKAETERFCHLGMPLDPPPGFSHV